MCSWYSLTARWRERDLIGGNLPVARRGWRCWPPLAAAVAAAGVVVATGVGERALELNDWVSQINSNYWILNRNTSWPQCMLS